MMKQIHQRIVLVLLIVYFLYLVGSSLVIIKKQLHFNVFSLRVTNWDAKDSHC